MLIAAPELQTPERFPDGDTLGNKHASRYADRVCSPETTLSNVEPLLRQHGITRVARITGLDRIGIPVWNAMRPNARSLSLHQGKGITDEAARASAVMEALERSVAENPTVTKRVETAAELSSAAVSFDPLESLIAYRQRPAEDDEAMEWATGENLLTGSSVLLPYEAIIIDRTRQARYWQSSDGLASGNTYEEAVLHGLLERVERDADTLWALERDNSRQLSRFDHADLNDNVVDRMVALIESAGLRIVLFDMTSDIGIPVVSALIGPTETNTRAAGYIDVVGGSGAHPVAARATIRAITEAVQSRLTLISGARDDVDPKSYGSKLAPSILRDLASPPAKPPPQNSFYANVPVNELLQCLLGQLASHVDRAYAVDLTPGNDRFSVVKVIVPDLENIEGARRIRFGMRALTKLTVF